MRARLRRVLAVAGRRERAHPRSLALLGAFVLVVAAAEAAFWSWALHTGPARRTLADAAELLAEPVPLDSALAVGWQWALGEAARTPPVLDGLLSPRQPPGLCAGEATPGVTPEIGEGIRRLDAAVRRGDASGLEESIRELRSLAGVREGARSAFAVRYNLARAYASGGDFAGAAQVLAPVFEGHVSEARVPETRRGAAGRLIAEGALGRRDAADAFHARYLAGTIEYARGDPGEAIMYFRRAINAVHYVLASEARGLAGEGHYERVEIALGDESCGGSSDEALTSLDAYAGLVAAYMTDEDFRDAAGLADEVDRDRLEMDPGDPFAPVLRLAAEQARGEGGGPLPEHLLWAASNLQRVYHFNRLRPEPALEVTRAALLLRLTREPTWATRIEAAGADRCAMLARLAGQVGGDTGVSLGAEGAASRMDTLRAVVALETHARLNLECGAAAAPVDAATRSAWLRLGAPAVSGGVAGRYEGFRLRVQEALGDGGAPARVLAETLRPTVAAVRSDRRHLARGRVPPDLPVQLDAGSARTFVDAWWRAVFLDVGAAMVAEARQGSGLRAGDVPRYLRTLHAAALHAGVPPADLHAATDLDGVAAAAGWGTRALYRVRWWVGSHPKIAATASGVFFVLMLLAGVAVHVSAWRYRIMLYGRRYATEAGAA